MINAAINNAITPTITFLINLSFLALINLSFNSFTLNPPHFKTVYHKKLINKTYFFKKFVDIFTLTC